MGIRSNAYLVGVLSAAVLVGGCSENFKAPPQTKEAVTFEARSSTLVIPVTADLDALQLKLNQSIPNPLAVIDENRDACVPGKWFDKCILPKPFGGCAQRLKTRLTPDIDCHLSGAAGRGDIALSGSGNAITLAMPVNVQITARGRGEIGKHIRETATGAADVTATAAIDIDENWKPSATLTADHTWTDRLGVTILGFRITFASKADEKINEALAGFQASLPARLDELNVRAEAEKAWMSGFTVLQANAEPPVWLRFTPEEIGFSGLDIAGRTATATVLAKGKAETFLGPEPEPVTPTPLPPLRKDLPAAGFEFQLPIVLDYAAISTAAGKALKVGEVQKIDGGSLGPVGLTFRKVSIYQSNDNLAIGVQLKVDPETDWFDSESTIWLTGRPEVDNDAKMVRVRDLRLFGVAENQLNNIIIKVAELPPVMKAIEDALSYDFASDYDKGIASANAAFGKQLTDGVSLGGSVADATIDAVLPGPDALMLSLSIRGTAAINVGAGL